MKLRTGKSVYEFPRFSRILDARVEGNQPHNQMVAHRLEWVLASEFPRTRARGFPTRFTVFADEIQFSPTPDKPYVVKVRYVPPVEEF